MSDKMTPISFDVLMRRVLSEYKQCGTIFSVYKLFKANTIPFDIFGQGLETVVGPAAGPHTQLAQNIIAAYAGGARFFELKTVQTLDGEDLPVSKPCIAVPDECYNVEWSTELYVPQAMDEYIKAYYALKLLSRELALGDPNGFVFNMSVGYDLIGIKSEKINTFIEGLKNAESTPIFAECRKWTLEHLSLFENIDADFVHSISPRTCCSVTLSTLHGCPPEEIERISTYLITEKGLNTYVKCNPTLLGYEDARRTLDAASFGYISFDEHHFKADLQLSDAVPMLTRLQKLAVDNSLEFGVKLTNTFPVQITEGELPGEEMYMSGRSLYLLSIRVAQKLAHAFAGKLRISYSGGADASNIAQLYNAGIFPITLATTLLKTGGYNRLAQLAHILQIQNARPFIGVDIKALDDICTQSLESKLYQKSIKPTPIRKQGQVPLIDCFKAPCRGGCPFGQDIPAYLRSEANGDNITALNIILEKNPLPFITGTICSHNCQSHCTRNFADNAVAIRAAKLRAANAEFTSVLPTIKVRGQANKSIAIVGGGPAGMAAAFLLAREGARVTIFERTNALGGIVRHVIPRFRISAAAIESDAKLLTALDVNIRLNCEVNNKSQLDGYDNIILATGAWGSGDNALQSGTTIDALQFLQQCEAKNYKLNIGTNVVVIGGGNTAMDTARAAVRVHGVSQVRLVYRRTKRYMPADVQELELAIADGVDFCELLAPISFANGILLCHKMTLGAPDAQGRRSPVDTGEAVEIKADTIITAIGQAIEPAIYNLLNITTQNGKPLVNKHTLETSQKGIYAIGDGMGGAATVAESIADATTAAKAILSFDLSKYEAVNTAVSLDIALQNRGIINDTTCLECASVCNACVDVCPNRANISVDVLGKTQIVHIDNMCNECGNCTEFCPYMSSPYKDKFTFFQSEQAFVQSTNAGFLPLLNGFVRVRIDNKISILSLEKSSEPTHLIDQSSDLPENIRQLIATFLHDFIY